MSIHYHSVLRILLFIANILLWCINQAIFVFYKLTVFTINAKMDMLSRGEPFIGSPLLLFYTRSQPAAGLIVPDCVKRKDDLVNEVLRAEGLCKNFRLSPKQQRLEKTKEKQRIAANDLSFSAYQGEIFGLLGPNGAGKTTTLRMLATLIKPDSGDAYIDGFSIVSQPDQVRARIGFLTSELKLEEFFTPNYLFDFFSELHQVPADVRDVRKRQLFSTFGIDKFAEVKVSHLSTGMKQKASLAISLVHDPSVIIFDEPTNGLDVLTAKVVTDFLLQLRAEGRTIIVSTHIFNLIEKLCDRVGILIEGKMILCDTLEAVCAGKSLEDRFFDLYSETVGEQE